MDNIYHLCVAKTGSQWIKAIFQSEEVLERTGMGIYNFEKERYIWDHRNFMRRYESEPFPLNTICTPTYMGFNCFNRLQKPPKYKAFSVIRDPRDIVVSFYFSVLYSHGQIGKHPVWREELSKLNRTMGLCRAIEIVNEMRMFDALRSHIKGRDPNYRVCRYEELIGKKSFKHFHKLFKWLEISFKDEDLQTLLDENSFSTSTGRQPGDEDVKSHRRKGVAGDWKNHFDQHVERKFYETTGDLVKKLEYE